MARIKKIMKLDEDVKMISQEAPLLFAKAAEIFISELALRSWIQTEDSKRRTLQVVHESYMNLVLRLIICFSGRHINKNCYISLRQIR